jgi:hypothetical protein
VFIRQEVDVALCCVFPPGIEKNLLDDEVHSHQFFFNPPNACTPYSLRFEDWGGAQYKRL